MPYPIRFIFAALVALGLLNSPSDAHGIAGQRLFPGTLTFDDPAVADELTGPVFSFQKHPTPSEGEVRDRSMSIGFSRLLTESTAIGFDTEMTEHRDASGRLTRGIGASHFFTKHQFYENDTSETLVSGSLAFGLGGIGKADLHAHTYNTLEPGVSFGVGFGDLPEAWSLLRPLGITGSVVTDIPLSARSSPSPHAPSLSNPIIVHSGFAVEFSTRYLSARYQHGQPAQEEPLNQWVPLIEFQFDTPVSGGYGRQTAATMNPGIAYVAERWQASIEWIVPLTTQGGSSGLRAGLIFFLDDALPSLFGQPILHPQRR